MKPTRKNILRKILFLCIFGISIVAIVMTIRWALSLFTIKTVIVSGDAAVIAIDKERFVGNTLLFSPSAIEHEIQDTNALVKHVRIKKHFPSTLEFIIEKRKSIARLVTAAGTVGIDEEAIVIEEDVTSDKPSILMDVPLAGVGQRIQNSLVKRAAETIYKTSSLFPIQRILKQDNSSIRVETPQSNIFIAQQGDIEDVVNTLQTLMEGFRIKGLIPKSIDIRFNKPVVQF